MASIKNDAYLLDTTITATHRFVVLSADGNTMLNMPTSELVEYLSTQVGGGGATDQDPDPFTFNPITDAQLAHDENLSNVITISGINAPTMLTTTGLVSINGAAFTSASGIVQNGNTIQCKLTSSDFALTSVSCTVTVGTRSATFTVTTGNFLTPFSMFPQQIHMAFMQEDLADGEVANWPSRGRVTKIATNAASANRPSKLADNGGVYFPSGQIKWLQWAANDSEPMFSHRWWLVIAKSNIAASSQSILTVNGFGSGHGVKQPRVYFGATGSVMGSDINDSTARVQNAPAVLDGTTWNVLLGWRRGQIHQCIVNGTKSAGIEHLVFRRADANLVSYIGASTSSSSTGSLWVDCIMTGDGELTDYQMTVLCGWAHWRVGTQALLPVGHQFKTAAPTMSDINAGSFHHEYLFDQAAYDTWEASTLTNRFNNRGQTNTYSETGYKRVWFTDFDQAEQAPVSDLNGPKGSCYYAPGWLTALGENASYLASGGLPWAPAYVLDTSATAGGAGRPGTLQLRIYNDGSWKGGAFYTINNNGDGRWWGKGIFKCRFKFDNLTSPLPGMFHSVLWSYGREHLFRRTRPRIEFDMNETTGKNAGYNNSTFLTHEPSILFSNDSTITVNGESIKMGGFTMSTATDPDFPSTLNLFDGLWHTVVYRVDDTDARLWLTYGNDTVLYEQGRFATTEALAMDKYLVADMSLSDSHGDRTPATSEVFTMTIDYYEVMQLATELAAVPTGFSARATIAGTTTSGATLTVTPNTVGSQIEYRWYRDGVPIVTALASTYVLTAADVGHKLACHVTNLSLVNQPYSWTADTATVT